jgi:predicted RNA binding protein YcfA (HicA-like mRNA interferase family)
MPLMSAASPTGLACHKGTRIKVWQRWLVKIREVLKALRQDGWTLKNQEGSHRQLVHPMKTGKVTVAGHEADDVPPKTLKSILKQAGLK